ncbi:MAG: TolC family protein [Myxococcales bacterium]|nr:TolC family protein [Myxococcales bacterium]
MIRLFIQPACARIVPALVLWAGVAVVVAIGGCGSVVHSVNRNPKPLAHVPAQFSRSGKAPRVQARWWTIFADDGLSGMCDAAIAGNLDLKRARLRMVQAAAVARQRGATLLPTASVGGQLGAAQQNFFFGGPNGANSLVQVTFPVNLSVNWEVDLWGRALNQKRAAEGDVRALDHDRNALALSLTAQVADVWLRRVEAHARLALLDAQHKLNQELLQLTQLRFGQGMATAVDVLQQQQQLEAVESQRPTLELSKELAHNQLLALMGKSPGAKLPAPDVAMLPKLPPLPTTGVPVKLLARRPDVRSAKQRVLAADHRLASAKAGFLPALRIGGSTGFQGRADPYAFFENFVWNLVGGVTAPLFQGGRIKAEVARSNAVLAESVLAYTAVVQKALWEVENALTQHRRQSEQLAAIAQRLELASATLSQTRRRFAAGQSNYLPVLQALAAHQRLESDHIGAQRQLLSTRIALYRALAGTDKSGTGSAMQGQALPPGSK